MGSILQETADYKNNPLWASEFNILNKELVINLHKKYISAGADIITTNTFRTNPIAAKASNLTIDYKAFIRKSVELAKIASESSNVLIAGSNAPAEDCYQKNRTLSQKELTYNHKKHIAILYESGVDLIINETISHLDEIKIIINYCDTNNIPFILSLFVDQDLRILSGELLDETIEFIYQFNPLAITVNCISLDVYKAIVDKEILVDGFYLNCGAGNFDDKHITCGINPDTYLQRIKHLLTENIKIIGTCCGSSPEHTKKLREYIDELYRD